MSLASGWEFQATSENFGNSRRDPIRAISDPVGASRKPSAAFRERSVRGAKESKRYHTCQPKHGRKGIEYQLIVAGSARGGLSVIGTQQLSTYFPRLSPGPILTISTAELGLLFPSAPDEYHTVHGAGPGACTTRR
ncbi:hypothetical protein Bbelb_385870 [Branchiostoma belcheri]|nr:hypothetical protein Bbelb_385870 [Branchiostoma belcheri]